jgi:hypothetical protein
MSTITKVIAALAFMSVLAMASAQARVDGDDSALSAYATFGGQHNVQPNGR